MREVADVVLLAVIELFLVVVLVYLARWMWEDMAWDRKMRKWQREDEKS